MKKGSRQYLERERRRREMGILADGTPVPADDGDGTMESVVKPGVPKPIPQPEKKPETMGEAYDAVAPAIRNYRNRMQKEDMAKEVRGIIEDGLGRPVSMSDLDDEIRDVGVTANTMIREAVQDHRGEFLARCATPEVDTTGDGRIDEEDEPLLTPGMRRMARYI